MNFASTRIITDDVARLTAFYELVTGLDATWLTEDFVELTGPGATLAIGSTRTVPLFGPGVAEAGANRSVIVEFLAEDVDARFAELRDQVGTWENEPTTMPWGNRSLLLRDPDGNLVNLFTPATPEARAKYGL